MAQISIEQWAKTAEGIEMIESQKVFCVRGDLWQGYKQVAIRTHEDQLSTEELNEVAGVRDVDGTMSQVWFKRRQRIEGRLDRKRREYNARQKDLREERTAIRQSIKEDKELNIPASAADIAQITEIDERMKRLRDLAQEQELEKANIALGNVEPEPPPPPLDPGKYDCVECGLECPREHHNPKMWLNGHMVKHRRAAAG
jgi:hypothetical protein